MDAQSGDDSGVGDVVSEEDPESVEKQYEQEDVGVESESETAEKQSISEQMGLWTAAIPLASILMLVAGMMMALADQMMAGIGVLVVALVLFVGFIVKFMLLQLDRATGGMILS